MRFLRAYTKSCAPCRATAAASIYSPHARSQTSLIPPISACFVLAGQGLLPQAATAKTSPCSITFTVLRNDRSGGVTLPAGLYRVTSSMLGCNQASGDFKTFLSKSNGGIPNWIAKAYAPGHGTYRRRNSNQSFTAKLIRRK